MTNDKVLYVPDVCELMGMSESALRAHIKRGSSAVPPPMKIGVKRIGWMKSTIEKHIAKMQKKAA